MSKKVIIIGAVILLLVAIGGGVFYWWQSGKELREINKDLPSGVKAEKKDDQSILQNEAEGYEIKIPDGWGGIDNAEYTGEVGSGQFSIKSKETDEWVSIFTFNDVKQPDFHTWVEQHLKEFEGMRFFSPIITGEETLNGHEVIKVRDVNPTGTFYFYFVKNGSKVLEIYTDYSENAVREVVSNIEF